jgi:hypothetical protein
LTECPGNKPKLLASFYSDDAIYLDPGVPAGISGKAELLAHFKKLLGYTAATDWNARAPLIQKAILHWDRLDLGPDPVRVVTQTDRK